jgi:hypothetical protein
MAVVSPDVEPRQSRARKRVVPSYIFRCHYYSRTPGRWIGECIDLDIIVEAKTSEQAQRELNDAVFGYLKVVFSSDDVKGLIPRPSPLGHRILYRLNCLRAALTNSRETFRISDCSSDHWAPCA